MMHDDMVTIHDKATVLYDRLDRLAVNGDLTVEQLVILDEALSLWVEAREVVARREYEKWLANEYQKEMESSNYYDDMLPQIIEEEEMARAEFEDWPSQHDVEVAMSEYDREDRV